MTVPTWSCLMSWLWQLRPHDSSHLILFDVMIVTIETSWQFPPDHVWCHDCDNWDLMTGPTWSCLMSWLWQLRTHDSSHLIMFDVMIVTIETSWQVPPDHVWCHDCDNEDLMTVPTWSCLMSWLWQLRPHDSSHLIMFDVMIVTIEASWQFPPDPVWCHDCDNWDLMTGPTWSCLLSWLWQLRPHDSSHLFMFVVMIVTIETSWQFPPNPVCCHDCDNWDLMTVPTWSCLMSWLWQLRPHDRSHLIMFVVMIVTIKTSWQFPPVHVCCHDCDNWDLMTVPT
jgi:hypothetical protein